MDDREFFLEFLGDGYEVIFIGWMSNEYEVLVVRVDYFMNLVCGIYYFEIMVLNKKKLLIDDMLFIVIGFFS